MAIINATIGKIDNMCESANFALLGTKLDKLVDELNNGLQYSGDLLTATEISSLNKMCKSAKDVSLGSVIEGLFEASQNATVAAAITDATATKMNKICATLHRVVDGTNTGFGTLLQWCVDKINSSEPDTYTDIKTFTVPNGTTVITKATGNVAIALPYGSSVTALIATFTLSEGATAKVGSTAQVSGTTSNDFTSPVIYTITAQDGTTTRDWTVTVTVALNDSTDILTYTIPTGTETIDSENKTIDVLFPSGTGVTALVATFTLSAGASAAVGATPQVSGTTANDFTSPVVYTITAEDGVTTENWTVTATEAEV